MTISTVDSPEGPEILYEASQERRLNRQMRGAGMALTKFGRSDCDHRRSADPDPPTRRMRSGFRDLYIAWLDFTLPWVVRRFAV